MRPVTDISIKMIARITSYADGELGGSLDSIYFEEPFVFTSVLEMIDVMETTFDVKGFPDKTMLPRTFGKAKQRMKKHEEDLAALLASKSSVKRSGSDAQSTVIDPAPTDVLATFEISVRYRYNAEWQGHLLWVESGAEKQFSSVVELVKLIDTALQG